MIFRDVLYGEFQIHDELLPFLKIPEFVRLRGVRLSNVDSFEFKDLNGPTRWDHALGVVYLAEICASKRGMKLRDRIQLCLAALLHDIATPPYAHTAEYVLPDFDHEMETSRLLASHRSIDVTPDVSIYLSEVAQFAKECHALSRRLRVKIDPDEVASMVVGQGEYGYLISGTLDLDNADNVTRASHFMGYKVDPDLPVRLARFLASCDSAPLRVVEHSNPDVREWARYRSVMYGAFFEASSEEKGREAFLQHLFRRAIDEGVPRRQIVWNTDEGLLNTLANVEDSALHFRVPLRELVRRYRLLEHPRLLLTIPIFDLEQLRALRSAKAALWIEKQLTTEYLEAIVSVSARRFLSPDTASASLLSAPGQVQLFKLGSRLTFPVLPAWLQREIPESKRAGNKLKGEVYRVLEKRLALWSVQRPWLEASSASTQQVRMSLDSMGDWSFKNSKNSSFHTYPSTFVQAIPASLIHALGVAGEAVLDPFGGTGNTALEAAKSGGIGVSLDSNWIATEIARVRTTYLSSDKRDWLRSLDRAQLQAASPAEGPEDLVQAGWHHADTFYELQQIKSLLDDVSNEDVRRFLRIAMSGILPAATARRLEQHGFFADNTPLPKGMDGPPYIDAMALFLDKIKRNCKLLEAIYASLERDGAFAETELKRITVAHADMRSATPEALGLDDHSFAAVVTSPPYLCMTDYTLGHRLSYAWLARERMESDFKAEMGARRLRLRKGSAGMVDNYLSDIARFVEASKKFLRPGGYIALVLGAPVARAFQDENVLERVDRTLNEGGLESIWSGWRQISWSRNHSYRKLHRERLSVYRW